MMSVFHELWIMVVLGCLLATQWHLGSCCSNEEKNSHLWQIGSNPPHYLFGTMHVPYNKLWKNIPDNVKAAFGSSQDVFVELDWADQATNNAINTCQLLPNNDTIDMHLSTRVFTRLRKYMRKLETEIPRWYGESTRGDMLAKDLLGGWQHKRPIWITLLLSSLNRQSVRSTASGTPLLDVFLGNAAHNMGKKLEAMENADDQCIPFNKLSAQQAEYILKKELEFLDQQGFEGGSDSTERSVNFYTCGDFEQMIMSESLLPVPIHNTRNKKQQELVKGIENVLTTHMVVKRNRKMGRTLLSTIKSNPTKTHFFAIGAGHLVGNSSVINYLRRRGVSVVHQSTNATISGNQIPEDLEFLGQKRIVLATIDISTLITTQPTLTTHGHSTTNLFDAYDILDQSGTTRPTYAMTLGPFFTMPTTVPITVTMPTISTTTSTTSGPNSAPTKPSTEDVVVITESIDTTSSTYASEDNSPLHSGANRMRHITLFRTIAISLIIYFRLLM